MPKSETSAASCDNTFAARPKESAEKFENRLPSIDICQ
jgi:hypothetical protein